MHLTHRKIIPVSKLNWLKEIKGTTDTKKSHELGRNIDTSMKIPSTPTAMAVLAMHGINSRRPPLATPPPSNYIKIHEISV